MKIIRAVIAVVLVTTVMGAWMALDAPDSGRAEQRVETAEVSTEKAMVDKVKLIAAAKQRSNKVIAQKIEAEAVAQYLEGAARAQREAERAAAERARVEAAERAARESRAAETPPPPLTGDVWQRLAQCESGMTNANTGNGYYGYFQFLPSTWHSVGGTGLPTDHGYAEQVKRAQILQQRSGWGQWPACSRKLGLR